MVCVLSHLNFKKNHIIILVHINTSKPNTVIPSLFKLIKPWVCSDNQKVWIIKACLFIYRALLNTSIEHTLSRKYCNGTVILTVWIMESFDNQWPDNVWTTVVNLQLYAYNLVLWFSNYTC